MPSPQRGFHRTDAARYVAERCVGPLALTRRPATAGPECLGLELEWLTTDPARPQRRFSAAELRVAVDAGGALPGGGRVSIEPGGQVELDTPPASELGAALAAARTGALEVRRRLAAVGAETIPLAIDPLRSPVRVLREPRYEAMERAFDRGGPAGRTMMCNTAALQLNVDLGPDGGAARWQLLDTVGPALAAAFANSPVSLGQPNGWRSARLAAWSAIDPSRTRGVSGLHDPVAAWLDYALGADVLFLCAEGPQQEVPSGFSFQTWMEDGHEAGWPTEDDWAYHLTTLFPPIRPRGWFEVRYLDALDDDHWPVAAAVVWGLCADPDAGAAALDAARGTEGRWDEAARRGAAHTELGPAGAGVIRAAAAGLTRLGADALLVEAVEQFAAAYPARGRCPADDVLHAHQLGLLIPEAASAQVVVP